MRKVAKQYYDDLSGFMKSIKARDGNGTDLDFYEGVEKAAFIITTQTGSNRKLIFIGNGASAAISSHLSTDFWKNGGMRAVAFNDCSGLTCIGNDYGYRHVFEKPIEMFAEEGDVLIGISSSGRSENVLLGVKAARAKACKVITLSGFKSDNALLLLGDLNFHVPAQAYGPVEVLHHSICHCILDTIMSKKNG